MNRRAGTRFIVAGLAMVLAALCLVAYNIYESKDAEAASSRIVEQLSASTIDAGSHATGLSSGRFALADTSMPTVEVDGYTYVGVLRIPSLGLELPVMNEWSYAALRMAPCRYSGTVYAGNMAIAAHNYSVHFGGLRSLGYGEQVTFTDVLGNVFVYEVGTIEELGPYAVEEMTESEWDLTLFTCTLGGAKRVTVRCNEVSANVSGYTS